LSSMEELILPQMSMQGSIADQFSTWSNLSIVIMNGNMLTGPLPSEIGAMHPQLTIMDFSSNKLTGQIPASIGELNLTIMQLQNNELTGQIPAMVGSISALGEFDCVAFWCGILADSLIVVLLVLLHLVTQFQRDCPCLAMG
jgi:hypothetical protein